MIDYRRELSRLKRSIEESSQTSNEWESSSDDTQQAMFDLALELQETQEALSKSDKELGEIRLEYYLIKRKIQTYERLFRSLKTMFDFIEEPKNVE